MKKVFILFVIFCMILMSACSLITDKDKPVYREGSILEEHKETAKTNTPVQVNQNKPAVDLTKVDGATSKAGSSEDRYTTFYYQDQDGLLIPITRKTPRVEGIAKTAIHSLIDMPVIREDVGRVGLYPVLPRGAVINGMTIKDGTAVIDFNEKLINYDSQDDESNIMSSIVYTLTEFDTINKVQVLVNGNKISGQKSENRSDIPMLRNGINSLDGYINHSEENKEPIEVYFVKLINNKYKYYVPITKYINKPTGDFDRYSRTLNELIKGEAGNNGLKSYIPKNTTLKGVQVEGQMVILDFDDEILSGTATDASFNTMLDQIVLCFKQFGRVKKVKVLVNGKPLEFPVDYKGKEALDVPVYVNQF
ncbi:MAG: GerMN domain-containing protein [Clostridia bacterium]